MATKGVVGTPLALLSGDAGRAGSAGMVSGVSGRHLCAGEKRTKPSGSPNGAKAAR